MGDTQIAEHVLAFLKCDAVALSADLVQVEAVVQRQARRIGAKVTELHLARQKLGYEGACRPCPCGRTQRFVEYRPKVVASQLGAVGLRRAYYRCAAVDGTMVHQDDGWHEAKCVTCSLDAPEDTRHARYTVRFAEAACKHVVGLRMKQSGMRWSKSGSQNTLSLRMAWLNGDWGRLWASRPLSRAA